MKRIYWIFAITLTLHAPRAFAQETGEPASKMEAFSSKTGTLIKFEDYKLSDIVASYGSAEARIRKISSGSESALFYQISYEGRSSTSTASIAREDLLELQKALKELQAQALVDAGTTSDYLENKFVTDDGFQLGYFISEGNTRWYITLEKYGSGSTVFMKDPASLETAFLAALAKMDELS